MREEKEEKEDGERRKGKTRGWRSKKEISNCGSSPRHAGQTMKVCPSFRERDTKIETALSGRKVWGKVIALGERVSSY
jgi:hypothetical protein